MKDPLDLTIIQQLLWELKPQIVIEFGAYKGGSALWIADVLKMFGCKSRVISIDIDLSLLDAVARDSPDVEFIEGDVFQVDTCFPVDFLKVTYSAMPKTLRLVRIFKRDRITDQNSRIILRKQT